MPPLIDLFVDCSGLSGADAGRAIPKWSANGLAGALARRIRGVVAHGTANLTATASEQIWRETTSPIKDLNAAIADAGCNNVPLLVVLGAIDVNPDAIGALRRCLGTDPMFGFAVPRIACADGCCFAALSRDGFGPWLPRRVLAELPDTDVVVELDSPCVLVAPQVAADFGPLDTRFDDVRSAVLQYMAAARRCGFRTVLSNRAVVTLDTPTHAGGPATAIARSAPDRVLLERLVPDLDRAWHEGRAGARARFETLCTAAFQGSNGHIRPSVLLDLRNVGAMHNGTTQAALGTAIALRACRPAWDVAVLASAEGAAFHGLDRALSPWPVHSADMPERPFSVALRLSQPWHICEMLDLHDAALFNVYVMLDTIAWDIAYSAPPCLEGTWQFLADHADGFIFDSIFTQRRFETRFPQSVRTPSLVPYFSFDPNEYVRPDAAEARSEDGFVLVIGNDLDHKDVSATVDTFASAFPYRRIKALGPVSFASPMVTGLRSGQLSDRDIHRLYATAEYVVFPSFYEGFGFPIVTALSYGRTVLARRSALLNEIAAHCAPRGRLVAYDRRDDLVHLLGKVIHGEAVPLEPLGTGLQNGRPRTWNDVAREVVGFVDRLLAEPSRSRWLSREHTVRQLRASHS